MSAAALPAGSPLRRRRVLPCHNCYRHCRCPARKSPAPLDGYHEGIRIAPPEGAFPTGELHVRYVVLFRIFDAGGVGGQLADGDARFQGTSFQSGIYLQARSSGAIRPSFMATRSDNPPTSALAREAVPWGLSGPHPGAYHS